MAATRSPIKQTPLHAPGESLQQQLDDLVREKLLLWLILPLILLLFAGLEWYRYLLDTKPSPILMTITALVACGIGVQKIKRLLSSGKQICQGNDGEKVVGQFLETLRSQGYQVFHDIRENGYNIDHVLIGATGVFAIETKTISKPTDHDATVIYDGRLVLVDGHTPDRDPLKQAQASADRIREILQTVTGTPVDVRPIVVYPGWYVEKKCRSPKVWVVNENLLPAYLDHEDDCLTDERVRSYAAILANHIRSSSANAGG